MVISLGSGEIIIITITAISKFTIVQTTAIIIIFGKDKMSRQMREINPIQIHNNLAAIEW